MTLTEFRKSRQLTLAQTAAELGISQKSTGWLSEIENGRREASLRLALRIEAWSKGEVAAGSVNKELAGHRGAFSAETNTVVVAPPPPAGAENSDVNVSRTEAGA